MEATLHSPYGNTVLGTGTISIGSTPDNQLVLSDAGVGARHVEIRPEGQGYSIIDQGTGSGTLVNGQRLYPQIPQMLQNGDTISIGSTQLTYEMKSSSGGSPTIYASPSSSGIAPTVMASGGSGSIPSTVYSSPTPGSSASYPPPSSPLVSAPAAPPPPVSGYSIDPYGSSQPKKKSRRGLWITVSVIGMLLVAIIIFITIASKGSTPTQTFQAYCTALKAKDGSTAYGLMTSGMRQQTSLDNMKALAASTSDCVVGKADDITGTAMITYTLASGLKLIEDDKVIQENNSWKIDSQKVRSTPSYTLGQYCNALTRGDFQMAYTLFSAAYQGRQSESQFAASFPDGKPSACTVNGVDDNAGKGSITMTIKGNPASYDETLINENGTWKIDSEQQK